MTSPSNPPSSSSLHQAPAPPPLTPLNIAKHTQYFLRCLRTHLPTHYQSGDSQRVSFAFFTLSALDLLGVLHDKTTLSEREEWATWLYALQHPKGGWKGFTGADVGGAQRRKREGEGEGEREGDKDAEEEEENVWDPADLGATFMALGALIVLGDSMERVRRKEGLMWLRGLQRAEGCFGEMRGKGGTIEGGGDVRFCYLAAGVRWMLRRGEEGDGVRDVDVEAMLGFVERCVTYEGGIAEVPGREAHAGETFCGIALLKFLGRLPPPSSSSSLPNANKSNIQDGFADNDFVERVTRWLVYRQTLQLHEEDQEEDDYEDEDEAPDAGNENVKPNGGMAFTPGFSVQSSYPMKKMQQSPRLSAAASAAPAPPPPQPNSAGTSFPDNQKVLWVGCNGRCNKVADTCYAWWVGGSLGMLQRQHLQNFNAVERYLLEKTQHRIGGFSKLPGDPPDILHSYLALAALAAMKHPDLKRIDSRLCMSVSAREGFEMGTVLGRGGGGEGGVEVKEGG